MSDDADVRFERRGSTGGIRLNRPRALNALTFDAARAILDQMSSWREDSSVSHVVIEGEGSRAFCAGGDVKALYDAALRRDAETFRSFYRAEYSLNYAIHEYSKPWIAALRGIVMGGGAGVSMHGSHRLADETVRFAMPETQIGFFPDVGASHFLSRLDGGLGLWLGLTGASLNAVDAYEAGLVTHLIPSSRMDDAVSSLDRSDGDVSATLSSFAVTSFSEVSELAVASLGESRERIDRFFDLRRLEGVDALFASLRSDGGVWEREQVEILESKSPTSLKVGFELLRRGISLVSFADAMRCEYRAACRMYDSPDFVEGVRAQVVDKDRSPRWRPSSSEDVSSSYVSSFFAPLEEELEL